MNTFILLILTSVFPNTGTNRMAQEGPTEAAMLYPPSIVEEPTTPPMDISPESVCEPLLGLLLKAEYLKLNNQHEETLRLLEPALITDSKTGSDGDCLYAHLLYANTLYELSRQSSQFLIPLQNHLERSILTFPDAYQFPLMALELCLYPRTREDETCDPSFYLHILELQMAPPAVIPRWARSNEIELRAEYQKRLGHLRQAAQGYHAAWDLNRENMGLLGESARLFSAFGMHRTSFKLYNKFLETKEARTGYPDRLSTFFMLQEQLLLDRVPNPETVKEFLQYVRDEKHLLGTTRFLLDVGKLETCKALLDLTPTPLRKSLSFMQTQVELNLKLHDYGEGQNLARTILNSLNREDTRGSQFWKHAFEQFLEACILNNDLSSAVNWCASNSIKFSQTDGFSRILLSLIIAHENSDRTWWNQTFYAGNLKPAMDRFRQEAEEVGLEGTLKRMRMRQYAYFRDNEMAKTLANDLTNSATLTTDLTIEIADTLATTGFFQKAMSLYKELLQKDKDNSLLLNNLGYFILVSGQPHSTAAPYIEKAINLEPDNTAYLDSLAWLHFMQGRYEEAKKVLETALDQTENDPVKLEHMGDILSALGQKDDAMEYWSQALKNHPDNYFEILNKLDPQP